MLSSGKCEVCGGALDSSLADLGCPVCLFQAGLEDPTELEHEGAHQFGSYVIFQRADGTPEELGRGSMGITFRAIDSTLNRTVALKIIDPRQHGSDRARERFMREARAAAGLRHQNVAAIHHFGVHEGTGQYFYAMELVEGETLEERVRRTGPISAFAIIEIAKQVTAALSAAEKRGLVHRDLKPGNIMLVGNEVETPEVKIIDFGLAKAVTDGGNPMAMTQDGFVGSPAFASPEQFAKAHLDVRSDIFSLGVTIWFALTGRTPFPGQSVEEIQALQRTQALPIEQLKSAGVSSRLIALVKSVLAAEPAARPGTAELAARLQRCGATNRTRLSILAATAVLLMGAAIFFMSRAPNERSKSTTSNAAAHEAFLKGRFFWNKRKAPEFETANIYFERAISLDPRYAQAYVGLADTYQFLANANRQVRDEYYAKAKQMSYRALELDPNLAEAHASLGLIAMNYDWDWLASEREFKRAIALDPNDAIAHQWYASYLSAQGRFDEAIKEIERARQLDPLSFIINTDAGQILLFAKRYKEAEEKLRETLRLDPRFGLARNWLGRVYDLQKRYDEALAEFRIFHEVVGKPWAWGEMGYVYACLGKQKEATEMLSLVEKECAADQTIDHIPQLMIYIGLGRNDDAFACLEFEYRSHSTVMTSLKVNPFYDTLRSDPRYANLMQRVRLAR
jgi:serine/threonine protein kinase